jgi:hypothetical protein
VEIRGRVEPVEVVISRPAEVELGVSSYASAVDARRAQGHYGHLSAYLAYVVASPRLLDTECRTVEQMKLLNARCRFVEVAERNGTNLTTA